MSAEPVDPNAMSPADPSAEHSCEHCGGHGAAPNPAERAREHLSLATRRLAPRLLLGVLGLGVAGVFAARGGLGAGPIAAVAALAALGWLVGAWGGVLLGALAAGRRSPRAQLALGQVFAAALGTLTAFGLGLGLRGLYLDAATSDIPRALGLAAMFGWFLAAAAGELVRVRSIRQRVGDQSEIGALARAEAQRYTRGSLQRGEWISLWLAAGYGAATFFFMLWPFLALVLVPLAAAGAAWWGLRRVSAETQRDS